MTEDDYEDDDAVGYGKPPKHTRFKKGQSGNPEGGSKKLRESPGAMWRRLLLATVTVNENGKTRTMTKLELVMSMMLNKAATGDAKNFKLFMEMTSRFPPEVTPFRLDRDDEEWLAEFMKATREARDSV